MKTKEEIELLSEKDFNDRQKIGHYELSDLKSTDYYHDGFLNGYTRCQEDISKLLEKAIEFGAQEMYSRKDLVDFVYFLNDRHFNKYTVDTDEVDLFIEFKKK